MRARQAEKITMDLMRSTKPATGVFTDGALVRARAVVEKTPARKIRQRLGEGSA
jgi:hypothetical protein